VYGLASVLAPVSVLEFESVPPSKSALAPESESEFPLEQVLELKLALALELGSTSAVV
jgi:hypothetical protein